MTVTAASTAASAAKLPGLPPGPKGTPLLGLALQVLRDPLGTLMRVAREYGDIVCIPVFRHYRIMLNHPDFIEQVCIVQHTKFHKSTLTKDVTQRLLGQGLLISEGDFWRRQRRLAQPAFHRTRIAAYGTTMVECANTHMKRWHDGEVRDIAEEMMAMTLDIAVRTLFGTTLSVKAEEVGKSLGFLMRYSMRKARSPIKVPEHWPTPRNRRAERETQFLDSLVYGIIKERQAEGNTNPHNDLLALLMGAMDEDGTQMTPKQLRDETMTFIYGRTRDYGADAFVDMVHVERKSCGGGAFARRIAARAGRASAGSGRPGAIAVFARGGERGAAALSCGLHNGANFDRAMHDRRIRFSDGYDVYYGAVGDASRSRGILMSRKCFDRSGGWMDWRIVCRRELIFRLGMGRGGVLGRDSRCWNWGW